MWLSYSFLSAILGPQAAILDFVGGAALQVVSECPWHCFWYFFFPHSSIRVIVFILFNRRVPQPTDILLDILFILSVPSYLPISFKLFALIVHDSLLNRTQ